MQSSGDGAVTKLAGQDMGAEGSLRRDALFVGVVILVGLAIATVDAFSVVHDRARAGRPVALWEPFVWETTSVVVLALLSPAVQAFTRRFRPLAMPWARVIPAHIAFALVFSLVHVAAMGVLRWLVYAALGDVYAAFGPLREFPYEFRKDLLVYFALVALYTLWLRLAEHRAAPDPEAQAIEVRDGARRRFVPLSEVAWIEAAGNYVQLHRGATPILHRTPLSALERKLQASGFVRIHRSRLVRRAAVAEVESKPSGDYIVRLANGRELAGSRRYRRPLLEP
jgi:DNA-binding LytR/AlgR family response regulator